MGRPLELRSGELRIAQRLTPSSPPASSLPSFLLSWGRLLPPSWPSRPRGRLSSSPRPSGRCCRSTACVARGPSGPSRGARPCTTGSSYQIDVVPQPDFDFGTDQVQVEPRLPILRAVHHPGREQLAELAQRRLDLVRLLLRQIPEAFRARHAGQVRDRLGHADPNARDRREGVPDRPRAVEVRVRHPDNVAEVLFHALEFLRRPRGLRLLLFLFFLLRGPRRLLGRRGGGRAFGFGCGLLVRHRVPWERGAPNSERYIRLDVAAHGRSCVRMT